MDQEERSTEVGWEISKRFFFTTDFNCRINNQYSNYFNTTVPLWNASLSKQILNFSRGELKFSVKDILNQNIGINRSANQNYIEDTRVSSLRRKLFANLYLQFI